VDCDAPRVDLAIVSVQTLALAELKDLLSLTGGELRALFADFF
jgi:hypothetical protein